MDRDTATEIVASKCFRADYGDGPWTMDGLADEEVRCVRSGDTYRIVAEQMYEAPRVAGRTTLDAVMAISEMFGTDKVDIESGTRSPGCDTCDYGSCYGTEILLTNPTRNIDILDALCGE